MNKVLNAALIGAALLSVPAAANAQSWGQNYGGYDRGYGYQNGYGRVNYGTANAIDAVCSGDRARTLESNLDRAVGEGRMDGGQADRIHGAIDNLEAQQNRECSQRDTSSIMNIATRYTQIDNWIKRSGYSRGYGYDQRGYNYGQRSYGYRGW